MFFVQPSPRGPDKFPTSYFPMPVAAAEDTMYLCPPEDVLPHPAAHLSTRYSPTLN